MFLNDYKLAKKINENGFSDRSIDYEIKRQKAIEQELCCKFIRIDPDKEGSDIFRAINETFRHINNHLKKILINKISTILLGLEFK